MEADVSFESIIAGQFSDRDWYEVAAAARFPRLLAGSSISRLAVRLERQALITRQLSEESFEQKRSGAEHVRIIEEERLAYLRRMTLSSFYISLGRNLDITGRREEAIHITRERQLHNIKRDLGCSFPSRRNLAVLTDHIGQLFLREPFSYLERQAEAH